MEFITLAVIAFLCLLSADTRTFALILLALLFIAFPLTFITILAVVIYFTNKFNRRNYYVPPTLPRND